MEIIDLLKSKCEFVQKLHGDNIRLYFNTSNADGNKHTRMPAKRKWPKINATKADGTERNIK